MRILLAGGGSGGPVSPLLAVAEEIKRHHPQAKFLLVGTKTGPEGQMAQRYRIPFQSIPAGKWRRYFSLKNLAAPFLVFAGFIISLVILRKFKPTCVFGAGSFVQVPLVWAARLFRVPVVLHQQDLVPSLANALCQAGAKKITVSFKKNLTDFSSGLGMFYNKSKEEKVVFTGNPFREDLVLKTRDEGLKEMGLKSDLPVLLVLGGGTGAVFLNELISEALPELNRSVQIVHSTGKNKFQPQSAANYHPSEFIENMAAAYAAADIVLCRAGLSTITELSNLKKLSIIVPMPDSHQEANALFLARNRAAIVATQERLHPSTLAELVRKLLFEYRLQKEIKNNISKIMPKDSTRKIAEIVIKQSLA